MIKFNTRDQAFQLNTEYITPTTRTPNLKVGVAHLREVWYN